MFLVTGPHTCGAIGNIHILSLLDVQYSSTGHQSLYETDLLTQAVFPIWLRFPFGIGCVLHSECSTLTSVPRLSYLLYSCGYQPGFLITLFLVNRILAVL